MFSPETAPIINHLAEEYAVFDHWYSSVPGPTDPNRAFAMGGTSMGMVSNFNGTKWTQESHINYLNKRNVSAGGYYQDDLWGLGYFEDLHRSPNVEKIKELDEFYVDLEKGSLPSYTWLQPRITTREGKLPTWQHPDARVSLGEQLIKDVYQALRKDDKWNETLFIITYDEHGGFYDHCTPPATVAPDGHDFAGFSFDRLGIRVPTLAISPWIKRGTIYNSGGAHEFDHTSLIKTTNEILLGRGHPAMSAREEWADSFIGVLSDDFRSDCPEQLPDIPALRTFKIAEEIERHEKKPLNEHLEGQLMFFCNMNYPDEYKAGEICESALGAAQNQGLTSKWLAKEQAKYFARMGRK